jgi:hypothetical protein
VQGEGEEFGLGVWERVEWGGAGVDQGAEDAGGGGFSAGGRAIEDEDGVGTLWPEGG